jgi:hypothetical protein
MENKEQVTSYKLCIKHKKYNQNAQRVDLEKYTYFIVPSVYHQHSYLTTQITEQITTEQYQYLHVSDNTYHILIKSYKSI